MSGHLTDRELMLAAHGELLASRAAAVREHVDACAECAAKFAQFEALTSDLAELRQAAQVEDGGAATLARARLQARLGGRQTDGPRWRIPWHALAAGFASVAAALVIFTVTVSAEGPKPKASLTPGEARPISMEEACRARAAEVVVRDIPVETRRRVFAAYGIDPSRPGEFEVDYLITPDLGGTASDRNLWPQPYSAKWNARQKDQLEERLHELVCGGQLDVATAQHEIASDWIAAYKKYLGKR